MPKELSLNMKNELVLRPDEIPIQGQVNEAIVIVEDFADKHGLDKDALTVLSEAFVMVWIFHRAYGESD